MHSLSQANVKSVIKITSVYHNITKNTLNTINSEWRFASPAEFKGIFHPKM